jgi:hypothetical protein
MKSVLDSHGGKLFFTHESTEPISCVSLMHSLLLKNKNKTQNTNQRDYFPAVRVTISTTRIFSSVGMNK